MVFSLNVSNAIHKARHAIGGADPITPADIGAEVAGAGAGLIAAERVTERANQSATYARPSDVSMFAPLKRSLAEASQSCAVQVLGDSTGNDTTEWVYLLAQAVAADYPAWTVDHRLWNDTAQEYAAATRIQTGTAGEQYMDLSAGTLSRKLAIGAAPHLTGIMDLRVRISAATWQPTAGVDLLTKENGYNFRSWLWSLGVSGVLSFQYTTDGINYVNTTSGSGLVTLPLNTPGWLRVTFNPDNGAGGRVTNFYQSVDGVTWTSIGTTITTAGAVVIFNAPTANYQIGGRSSAIPASATKIHEVQFRDGLGGKIIAPCKPDQWSRFGTPTDCPVVGAPVLTIVNGSMAGAAIAYLGDATRLPKLTPDYGQVLTFLSDSHNEAVTQGTFWQGIYAAWVTAVKTRLPAAPIVAIAQNPERIGTLYWNEHAARRRGLLTWARSAGVGVVDVFKAFTDYGNWQADLMLDDAHPNAAGSSLWRDTIKALLDKSA